MPFVRRNNIKKIEKKHAQNRFFPSKLAYFLRILGGVRNLFGIFFFGVRESAFIRIACVQNAVSYKK